MNNTIGDRVDCPWGHWELLAVHADYVIKHVRISSGMRLSLQRHFHREEVWVITRGTAKVTLGEEVSLLVAGDSIRIPLRAWHRIENVGEGMLEFVETQTGSRFDEDDIERKEDDFGRVCLS